MSDADDTQLPQRRVPGKPPHWSWKWFEKSGAVNASTNRCTAKCKACGAEMAGRTELMPKHVIDCQLTTPEDKAEVQQKLSAAAGAGARVPVPAGVKRGRTQVTEDETSANSLKRPVSQSGFRMYAPALKMAVSQRQELDTKLVRLFACGGLPFHVVDTPFWINYVRTLNPGYVQPGRKLS